MNPESKTKYKRYDEVFRRSAVEHWMVSATNTATGANVRWQSVATRTYWLERATNLGFVPPFRIVATNISGVTETRTFVDTSATNGGPYFYRVGVK